FLSWYNIKYGTNYTFYDIDTIGVPVPGTPEARFGCFNDSYAAGDEGDEDEMADDWGSLSEGADYDDEDNWDSFDRGRVINWIRNQNNVYGGEAQGDPSFQNTYPFVAWEASVAQTVYLNRDYQGAVHNRWKSFTYNQANVERAFSLSTYPYELYGVGGGALVTQAIFDPVYNGQNGAAHWRDRLGYRLVVREANASEWVAASNGTLVFEGKIQNVGFGNVINRKRVAVLLRPATGAEAVAIDTGLDARDWRVAEDGNGRPDNQAAWRDLAFTCDVSGLPAGRYDLYLKVNDPLETSANRRCIQFANHDIWDAGLGANRIGAITLS
ncbi:MAG: DUF4832 domain-containing protein, partial [Promicromonosporaceae bacterium]|nr:DUF4832 domain-containing protein [Promicromonosporaceae bacterium]